MSHGLRKRDKVIFRKILNKNYILYIQLVVFKSLKKSSTQSVLIFGKHKQISNLPLLSVNCFKYRTLDLRL